MWIHGPGRTCNPTWTLLTGGLRLQPACASAKQSQQAWRCHKLKKRVGSLHQRLDVFIKSVQDFTKSRLQDTKAAPGLLRDVQIEPFPEKGVLFDSTWFIAQGRSSANEYHRTKCFDFWSDGVGTTYYTMPSTLAAYEKDRECWAKAPTPNSQVQKPPLGTAKALAGLFLATRSQQLEAALKRLGMGDEPQQDLSAVLKTLSMYILVIQGQAATKHWRVKA